MNISLAQIAIVVIVAFVIKHLYVILCDNSKENNLVAAKLEVRAAIIWHLVNNLGISTMTACKEWRHYYAAHKGETRSVEIPAIVGAFRARNKRIWTDNVAYAKPGSVKQIIAAVQLREEAKAEAATRKENDDFWKQFS